MEKPIIHIKYTICFVFCGEKVLLIRRNKEPYRNRWNGLGGKIEGEETARENIIREMKEEANLDLTKEAQLRYGGVVTWKSTREEGIVHGGMVAYVAQSDNLFSDRETREGLLSWRDYEWVCDKKNSEIAENIPFFLPQMRDSGNIREYHCTYVFGELKKYTAKPLPKQFSYFF